MKKSLIVYALVIILIGAVVGGLAAKYLAEIDTTGEYEGNLELSPSTFNWGILKQNESVTKSVNITNHGDTATLNFTYDEPMGFNTTLECDAQDATINKDQTIMANFTLTIHNGTAGQFNLKIYVEATTT